MGCKICESAEIGYIYEIGGTCQYCGTRSENKGEYKGMSGANHVFRLHPSFTCTGCGKLIDYSLMPCKDLIEVTEEFHIMKHRKDSHWVGK